MEGVVIHQKNTLDEVQNEVNDKDINGKVTSEPNKIKPVISNLVPFAKTTFDVSGERTEKDQSSKLQLNPLGKYLNNC